MALSSNFEAFKVQTLETLEIFGKVTENPHFLKTSKWGTKGNFSKIAQKKGLV